MSEGENPKRSLVEFLTFRGIETVVLLVRFFVILYFCMQAYKHFRLTQHKDMYSVATFLFLAISLMMLLLSRISDFIEQTLIALYDHDSLVVDWFKEHATLIRVSRIITRFLIGHLCQNIALIVNTERWLVIL